MKCFLLLLSFCYYSFLIAQQDSAHYFTSFDRTRIYYEDKGSGYPVILVHGFLNTSQNWKRTYLYKALLDAGYRVITPDLRGNGKSGKPYTDDAYADDAEAKDIMFLTGLLKINSYNVVGYSRGSIITSRLLVLDKKIRQAVLGGMGTDFTDPKWPRRVMFYHLLNGDTTIQEFEPLIKRLQTDTSLNRKALTLQQKYQPSTPVTDLRKIAKPVLVICGRDDPDNEKAKALAEIFRKGTFATVPGDHNKAVTTKEFSDSTLLFFSNQHKQ